MCVCVEEGGWQGLGESEALKWTMRKKTNRQQNLHLVPYEVQQRNASPDSTSPPYPPLADCLPVQE